MILNNVSYVSTSPRGQKRLIHAASGVVATPTGSTSSLSPSILKTAMEDVKHGHGTHTNHDETRHDVHTILRGTENEDRISSISMATMDESEQMTIQRRHRRTYATTWNELTSRLDSSNDNRGLQPRKHRRSLALTEDEFIEITMDCDELYGLVLPLHL